MEQKIIQTAVELYHYQRVLSDPRIDETLLSYLELFHDFNVDAYDVRTRSTKNLQSPTHSFA